MLLQKDNFLFIFLPGDLEKKLNLKGMEIYHMKNIYGSKEHQNLTA